MTRDEFSVSAKAIKRGTFVKASWKTITIGKDKKVYTKTSEGVVRIVRYGNIKGVVVKGKPQPNIVVDSEYDCLYHNTLTQSILVQFATTKNPPKVISYECDGVKTTKEEYELVNPPRKRNDKMVVFRVKLENLLKLGNN